MPDKPKRPGIAFWATVLLVVAVLYVLSSGPAQFLTFSRRVSHEKRGRRIRHHNVIDTGPWWPQVYAPLWWAAEQPWGRSLHWYWSLFPIRDA